MGFRVSNKIYGWLLALFLSLALGLLCSFYYSSSPRTVVDVKKFSAELKKSEQLAVQTLNMISDVVEDSTDQKEKIDLLRKLGLDKQDISYYLYSKQDLLFWTNNHIYIDELLLQNTDTTFFVELPNAYSVAKTLVCDDYLALAIIPIKYNYPYENELLINEFTSNFSCDKAVNIKVENESDTYAVFDMQNRYLFSLVSPHETVYVEFWGWLSFIAFFVSMFLFLIVYVKSNNFFNSKELSLKQFGLITLFVFTLIAISLYFNYPRLLYWNRLFTAFQYASNHFLSTLSHLTIATLFFFSFSYLFYSKVKLGKQYNSFLNLLLQIFFGLYFSLLYYVIASLVFNSNVDINIIRFNEFSFVSVWFHLLLLVWGFGLSLFFLKTHHWLLATEQFTKKFYLEIIIIVVAIAIYSLLFPEQSLSFGISFLLIYLALISSALFNKNQKNKYSTVLLVFAFGLLFVGNSIYLKNKKDFEKHRVLAQNIMINGNTENDSMAEFLLEDMDKQLMADTILSGLIAHLDSVQLVSDYLRNTYMRGFWNKYDIRLNIVQSRSELDYQYKLFLEKAGVKLKDTHFYSFPSSFNDMSYLGIFPNTISGSDSLFYYIEFYQSRNFRSFSFPNLLMNAQADGHRNSKINVGNYKKSKLVYESPGLDLPIDNSWLGFNNADYFSFTQAGKKYYVYQADKDNQVVISEKSSYDLMLYGLNFMYTFLIYYLIIWLLLRVYKYFTLQTNHHLGLTKKYQYSFIGLLIFSFLGIFYVSVNYIQNKYKADQVVKLDSKKNYIQNALQEKYYWNEDLLTVNVQNLNFDLQELSMVYQTDIHVYDNYGVLVGSSQPLIFSKNLVSRHMSPEVYFGSKSNVSKNEYIGKLKYLTGYTQFLNGDYLQLGYIAVPQYLSREQIRDEIQEFLAVIIHIYLIIIILSIILSVFIGRQLSAPLKVIENKLKEMRFGHRNEKVVYAANDEIGQLVSQYNRTVDELEKSAKLLAQSEREHAWKTMARQIAHEINNPLTPMKLTIQQLQRTKNTGDDRFDDYFEKSSTTLIEQIDNLSRIAVTFSNFARMPEAHFVKVDIAAKLFSVIQLFVDNNSQMSIKYSGKESGIFILADSEQLTQVFNNLMKNAIQSIPKDRQGLVEVNISTSSDKVKIDFTDNGAGISDEISDKLFMPNFTTKSTGMGLGLSITKNIVELSDGEITFETELNVGTTFSLEFPMFTQ